MKRIRIMKFTISGLATGKWRYFSPQEIKLLEEQIRNSSGNDNMGNMDE